MDGTIVVVHTLHSERKQRGLYTHASRMKKRKSKKKTQNKHWGISNSVMRALAFLSSVSCRKTFTYSSRFVWNGAITIFTISKQIIAHDRILCTRREHRVVCRFVYESTPTDSKRSIFGCYTWSCHTFVVVVVRYIRSKSPDTLKIVRSHEVDLWFLSLKREFGSIVDWVNFQMLQISSVHVTLFASIVRGRKSDK